MGFDLGGFDGGLNLNLNGLPAAVYQFETFFHPYVCEFVKVLEKDGIDGLLRWQLSNGQETSIQQSPGEDPATFENAYGPVPIVVQPPFPHFDVEFAQTGQPDSMPYSIYNWEIFFHAPLYIAGLLSQNQRFEEAERWYHYIFDATDASVESAPARYWKFLPFRLAAEEQMAAQNQITDELAQLFQKNDEAVKKLDGLVRVWRGNAFDPHLVARGRVWEYPKAVVMKYLDNLIAWGDLQLAQNTMESRNFAALLFIRAAEILGDRSPSITPKVRPKPASYNDLAQDQLDGFSDAYAATENLVFGLNLDDQANGGKNASPPPPALYFAIPKNVKLLGYWDTVADRLFKLRHCMNLQGVVQQLPLFEPPIDPDLLVRAAAAGIDLSTVLNDLNAPVPHYRFPTMLQKAVEFCGDVRSLGAALLSALEKRDAEALARLRSTQEVDLLTVVRQVKEQQVEEAQATLDGVTKAREVIQIRLAYYTNIAFLNPFEMANLAVTVESLQFQTIHLGQELAAAILHLIPNFKVGFLTTVGATYGGENVASALQAFGGAMNVTTSMMGTAASLAATMGSYARRQDEWALQKNLAAKELEQSEKQLAAAQIRLVIAQKELANHDKQIANATAVDDFMKAKFTNQELFEWMVSQTSSLYFQSYQLAYNMAKRAERAYQFDLADYDSLFVTFGYWESLRNGLVAGDRLQYDLRRLEAAYLDGNQREFELTKDVSLALLAPEALIRLRETGECFIELPESLFARDHPECYLMRLWRVGITIPNVAGPYTGVNCRLTLTSSRIRMTPDISTGYPETPGDSRFRYNLGAVQVIATSSGRNDTGTFEPHDERRPPFLGAGAISQWRLEVLKETNRFPPNTISEVIMHLQYTGRDAGEKFKQEAMKQVLDGAQPPAPSTSVTQLGPGLRLFSARREFPDDWYRFLHQPDDGTSQTLQLDLSADRFPYRLETQAMTIDKVHVLLRYKAGLTYDQANDPLTASLSGFAGLPVSFAPNPAGNQLIHGSFDVPGSSPGGGWVLTLNAIPKVMSLNKGSKRLDPALIDDCFLLCSYAVK
jgi:hypothetical protein